jgi:hypothetical protein
MTLTFLLLANKPQTSYEDVFRHAVSEAEKLLVTVFPTIFYADFENPSQRSDNSVARL